MYCEECFNEDGRHQLRYYYDKFKSDFCPTHGWKKREIPIGEEVN